ncbi:ribonuclease H-like domain-containing protein, partial [Cladochytrium replicatum]
MATHCPYEVLVALDLESTCDENHSNPSDVKVPRDQGEIIELSFAVISVAQLRVVHQQQIFVRPEQTPLTAFCTQLTGITQETIDENGVSLAEALGILDGFIKSNVGDRPFSFVCHGEWDLRYQLSRESREKNISLPGYFSVFFDAIQETNLWLSLAERAGPRKVQASKNSLVGLCTALGIQHQGRLHSGIDDALTISKIVLTEVASGQPVVVPTRWPFETPVNLAEQLAEFHETRSTVVHLGGLPYKATINEVDAWVAQAGIKAAELWMVRNVEGRPDGTGFAVFHSHEDAKACLALNGRILGDRTIQVAPATANDLEQTAQSRTPFPTPEELAHQQPEMKPGDWLCSSCQYHNFASRRSCFKCHVPSPNSGGANGSVGTSNGMNGGYSGQPSSAALRPGDWVCPHPSCRFQNFASRLECMRCRTRRPPMPSVGGPPMNFGGVPSGPAVSYAQQPTGGMPRPRATDRPGDWNCPNESCRYHNYASRMECYRCGT